MSTKKRGLGKGLSALIPDEPFEDVLEEDKNNIVDLDIDLIKPNKEQPRKNFDKDALEELKESIQNYGVIQPIIVRKIDKGYEIIAGERRWKAAKMASIKKIQNEIAKNIIEKKLNVRETENIVNTVKNKKNSVKKSNKEDPFISEARDKFMKKLGTKVVIKHGKNKGKIEIEYYSPEDFERIMDIIIKN